MIALDGTLFIQIAIFLAFTVFLNVALLKPMGRYLSRRAEGKERPLADAARDEESFNRIHTEYVQKISSAKDTILEQRTAARKEAMDIQQAILEEARKEAFLEIDKADSELQKEIMKAREILRTESLAIASALHLKVLSRAPE